MANSEACELYIEQQIKEELKEGKNPHQIGRELSTWIAKLFQVHIPERTLEQRARRVNKKERVQRPKTDVTKKSKPATDKPKDNRGGAREGSGRPYDYKAHIEKEHMLAFSNALDQIEVSVNTLYDLGGKYWERNQDEIVFTLKSAFDQASEKRGFYEAEKEREAKARKEAEVARKEPRQEEEKAEEEKPSEPPSDSGINISTTEMQHKLIKRLFSEDENVRVRVKYFSFANGYTDSILSELKKLEMVDQVAAKLVEKIKFQAGS